MVSHLVNGFLGDLSWSTTLASASALVCWLESRTAVFLSVVCTIATSGELSRPQVIVITSSWNSRQTLPMREATI